MRDADAPELGIHDEKEVMEFIEEAVLQAKKRGIKDSNATRLRDLLIAYIDVLRTKTGTEEPIRTEPAHTDLKPDAIPYRCKPRFYNPAQQDYMDEMMAMLEKHGLVFMNMNSRWASPALIVKRPGHNAGYRLVVDLRKVNSMSVPMAWPMPNLEAATKKLNGAKFFYTLDAFKGFWLMGLSEECREMFSFMTDKGVYTPTRAIQGALNSSLQFQARMSHIFRDMLDEFLMIWIDDLLGFASSEEALLDQLEQVFRRAREYGVKFSAKKLNLFTREIKWCGRIYSKDGVTHDPQRVAALQDMHPPETVKELQQFLYSANWMRTHIPDYGHIILPLSATIDRANAEAKRLGHNKITNGMMLKDVGYGEIEEQAFERIRKALINHVKLSYPDPQKLTCVFPDASDHAWAAVITQIPPEDRHLPVQEQRHEPLAFYGKRFTGSSKNWSICEKEAFAIIECTQRGEFLLRTNKPFLLYTDHANLVTIFNADGSKDLKRNTTNRLQRWAMHLQSFLYEIEGIRGEDNTWADLLSRWAAGRIALEARRILMSEHEDWKQQEEWPEQDDENVNVFEIRGMNMEDLRVRPLGQATFTWPTEAEIRERQAALTDTEKKNASEKDGLWQTDDGRILIPKSDIDLQVRLLAISHCSAAGHRASDTTKKALQQRYLWSGMVNQVKTMCDNCLHCITTRGGDKVPRPWGETVRGTYNFEVMHMDWLYMEPVKGSHHNMKYVLVLKDDLSGYVRLYASARADSRSTAEALNQWMADLKTPKTIVSDQGTHFLNQTIRELNRLRGIKHHFVTAYSPWANGTVERANRTILAVCRAILDENKLPTHDWPYLLPVIQHAINHAPSDRNDGIAPITAVLGAEPDSPLDHILLPHKPQPQFLNTMKPNIEHLVRDLRSKIGAIHRRIQHRRDRIIARNLRCCRGAHVNFQIGDFVLMAKTRILPGNKLMAKWLGPMRIDSCVNDHVYMVSNMATGKTWQVHTQRLRPYADASLHVTEEIKEHLRYVKHRMTVKKLSKIRYDSEQKNLQILVEWLGLEPEEATWEPVENLLEDVPRLVRDYHRKLGRRHKLYGALTDLLRNNA